MNTVSIWWGYASGAALFNENRVLFASSEERFNRIKNTSAFPINTINEIKRILDSSPLLGGGVIDNVVYTGNDVGVDYLLVDKGAWSVSNYVRENKEYWFDRLYYGEKKPYLQYLRERGLINFDVFPGREFWDQVGISESRILDSVAISNNFDAALRKLLCGIFNVPNERLTRVDHHTSHRYYAALTRPNVSKNLLVFTVDGWGDGRNATVAALSTDSQGVISETELFSSSSCSLARTYRFMTLLLGMKPSEHEFKVMGLASYSKEDYCKAALKIFSDSMHYSPANSDFIINPLVKDSFFWFREELISERFDNIACGLQMWCEHTLIDWVKDFVFRTNIRDVAFSGGVAMNVKAMTAIGLCGFVDSIHVPPTAGDESHIFGAYFAKIAQIGEGVQPFDRIPYLGFENVNNGGAVLSTSADSTMATIPLDVERIVDELCGGGIVAVCRGRAEFGSRALGNRSFLVDASSLDSKNLLNQSVKNRDFWMPFAPLILDSYAERYLRDWSTCPTRDNRFMTVLFNTTPLGEEHMRSAIHPADKTCRAQILKRSDNDFLYNVLEGYAQRTGRGALLNTSFNTHGSPIVNTYSDAIDVFRSIPVDMLILDNEILVKATT